jgi:hypothetical protein
MKKLVIGTAIIAAIATTVASATIIASSEKQRDFEAATRAQTLAVIAANNGNFNLACRAQSQAVEVLSKVHTKGKDIKGYVSNTREQVCHKAS